MSLRYRLRNVVLYSYGVRVYIHSVFRVGWPTFGYAIRNGSAAAGDDGWRWVVWHWCSGSVCPEGVYKHVALDGIFSLSLVRSVIIYYHYYCTNQPAGRSFHFPNVVNRQTERNPRGKQRLRHCQLTRENYHTSDRLRRYSAGTRAFRGTFTFVNTRL